MKAVGEAAQGLLWIAPCASSLVSLAKEGPAAWQSVRTDVGAVLLAVRAAGPGGSVSTSVSSLLESPQVLRLGRSLLKQPVGWVDWDSPGAARLLSLSLRQACLAQALAHALPGCDADKAWIGGLLAPLGCFAVAAVDRVTLEELLETPRGAFPGSSTVALGRRLARSWQLPVWLQATISHLGLHVATAQRLGAEPRLFQVVQLACGLVQRAERVSLTASYPDFHALQAALSWSPEYLEHQHEEARQAAERLLAAPRKWRSPFAEPLLRDLLEVSGRARESSDGALIDYLHRELDQLQCVLEEHQLHESDRLHALKLSSLAELAAGAGHEINNPLAVISGQAQYALKQVHQAEMELVEDTHALAVLGELRGKIERSLTTISGQVQRIHHVLTDLMQFARPGTPRRQAVSLRELLSDVVKSLQSLADGRKVRLVFAEPPAGWQVNVDAGQVRSALTGLLRNAVEAAPPEGWAGMRAEARGAAVGIVVEDSGPGPTALALEHMFDPFFSGRSAGRGRGLGLSTAWRLAKQHGGEVRFEGMSQGVTRFVMTLPDLKIHEAAAPLNGEANHGSPEYAGAARNGANGSH